MADAAEVEEEEFSDPDDEVVQEMDVYLCKGNLPEGSKMYLLQSPLRPPWRPYELENAGQVQMKPAAGRLQIDVPLETAGANVDQEAAPSLKMQRLRLSSSPAELPTNFAIGSFRDGKLLLWPVDEALQLRPTLEHLDEKAKPSAGVRPEEDEDVKPQLQAVKVNVQRRETERQAEMRLKSYSHYAAQERDEVWVPLSMHDPVSAAAEKVWERLGQTSENALDMSMSQADYLAAIVPGAGIQDDSGAAAQPDGAAPMELGAPAAALPLANGSRQDRASAPGAQTPTVKGEGMTPAAVQAAEKALKELFTAHSVIDLPSIKNAFLAAGDRSLQQALGKMENVVCIRGSYMQHKTGNTRDDPFRSVLLQLLQEKEALKRNDIMQAAQAESPPLDVNDSMYSRVVKDLMFNSGGGTWRLKNGDNR